MYFVQAHISTITSICSVKPKDDLFVAERPKAPKGDRQNDKICLRTPDLPRCKIDITNQSEILESFESSSLLSTPKHYKRSLNKNQKDFTKKSLNILATLFEYKDILKRMTLENAVSVVKKQETKDICDENGNSIPSKYKEDNNENSISSNYVDSTIFLESDSDFDLTDEEDKLEQTDENTSDSKQANGKEVDKNTAEKKQNMQSFQQTNGLEKTINFVLTKYCVPLKV